MWIDTRINDWSHFSSHVGLLWNGYGMGTRPAVAFRGEPELFDHSMPSLGRLWSVAGEEDTFANILEDDLADAFTSLATLHHNGSQHFLTSDKVELWMLMQHYGAPTRLLDWTASPYVALYFAVTGPTGTGTDGRVYFANIGALNSEAATVLEIDGPSLRQHIAGPLERRAPTKAVFFERPKHHTERTAAQQTIISVGSRIALDHVDTARQLLSAYASRDGGRDPIVGGSLTIPGELKLEFLDHLRAMNITGRSLFPGLDGLGREMRDQARFFLRRMKP